MRSTGKRKMEKTRRSRREPRLDVWPPMI